MSVDWGALAAQLPTTRTPEAYAQRSEMFSRFDPNGNGYLSLAEVDKGVRDILDLPELFDCKPVINRAFHTVKGAGNRRGRGGGHGPDYVERSEFRLLLVYLRQYFELWHMFSQIDSEGDRRLSVDEFEMAVPLLNEWGANITNARDAFDVIDTNHGGKILFTEFVDWGVQQGLDVLDDDDFADAALS